MTAVFRNMQAGIVMQIKRDETQIVGQGRTVIVPIALPLPVIHQSAMDQDDQVRTGWRMTIGKGLSLYRLPIVAQPHGHSQWIILGYQMVAEKAIHNGQYCFSRRRCSLITEQLAERSQRCVNARPDETGRAADTLVNKSSEATGLRTV